MALRRNFDIQFKEKVYAEEHSGEKAAKQFDIDETNSILEEAK